MIFTTLLNFLFCSRIVFLICLSCHSVFSCTLVSFFNTVILNSFLGKSQISTSLGWITGRFCDPCCVMLPWSLMLPEVSQSCLHIWSSSHLLQSLLTAFGREIPSVSLARYSEASVDTPSPHSLLPLVAEFLNRACLFSILQSTKESAHSLSFFLSKVVLKLKFVVSSWPTDLGQFSTCAH